MRAPLVIAFSLLTAAASLVAADKVVNEVRHEVLLVPGYTVFDWLAYRVDGNKVTLLGAVSRPELKHDVENAVKHIEGVEHVQNDIEVLPNNAVDDRIRHAILLSVNQEMSQYLAEQVRRIHIVVKNQNVALEGEVSSQSDKDRVDALAKHAPGVHNVANNLVIQK